MILLIISSIIVLAFVVRSIYSLIHNITCIANAPEWAIETIKQNIFIDVLRLVIYLFIETSLIFALTLCKPQAEITLAFASEKIAEIKENFKNKKKERLLAKIKASQKELEDLDNQSKTAK